MSPSSLFPQSMEERFLMASGGTYGFSQGGIIYIRMNPSPEKKHSFFSDLAISELCMCGQTY